MHPLIGNVGLPMLVYQLPLMVVGLPVIIAIETWVLGKYLQKPAGTVWKVVGRANLISTFVGVPCAWAGLVVLQFLFADHGYPDLREPWYSFYMVTAQAAWMPPLDNQSMWKVPTAILVLMIPFFFATVWIEHRIYRKSLAKHYGVNLSPSVVWKMHLASYSFLVLITAILLIQSLLSSI